MADRVAWTPTKKVITAVVAVCVVTVVVGVLALMLIKSPQQIAAETAPPKPSDLTARVTVGSVQQGAAFAGEVSYGNAVELSPATGGEGAAIVTKVLKHDGDVIAPGDVLFEVADRPVIVLPGEVPLLRDLRVGDRGADVTRLQEALKQTGYVIGDYSGYFGRDTQYALRLLYDKTGYAAPGQEDGASSVPALTTELVFAPDGAKGSVVHQNAKIGQALKPPAMEITTKPLVVTTKLEPEVAKELQVKQAANIIGSGIDGETPAVIAEVSKPQKDEGENQNAAEHVRVTVTPQKPLPAELLGAQVSVHMVKQEKAHTGLLVPLAALQSGPKAQTFVTVVSGKQHKNVAVTVVETGDGQALITATKDALSEGDIVLIGKKS